MTPHVQSISALQVTSTRRYLLAYAGDFAIIGAAYAAAGLARHWLVYGLAALVLGTRQHAIGILGHDGSHGLISRNRNLNRVLTELGTWPLLVNVHDGYKEWHMAHHRALGTPQDPELSSYRRLSAYHTPVPRLRVLKLFMTDLSGLGLRELLMFVAEVRPRRLVNWLGPITWWVLAFGIAAWAHLLWVPLLWVASLLTAFWAVFRVRTFAEHVGETAGPGREASHRYEVGRLGRFFFFPHNVWYHYEHHVYASVPFFNLPQLRTLLTTRPVHTFSAVFERLAVQEADTLEEPNAHAGTT
jgi:fatty acid desaturase